MPKFSTVSQAELDTCVVPLQILFSDVVEDFDCTVLEGKRSIERQRRNVAKGVSKTMDSKHLVTSEWPKARAADVAPFPLRWPQKPEDDSPEELKRWMKDYARYYYFAGYVLARARALGFKIRWGGDWDGDRDIHEQNFDDLAHFEVVE